jgi:DivIVA domain-containing protein
MPLTPEDVQSKTFKETRFKPGYVEDEVDAFLDEVETELRRLLSDNGELRAHARSTASPTQPTPTTPALGEQPGSGAPAEPSAPVTEQSPATTAGADDGQQAALRTLLLAQRTADEAVAEARAEAEQIRAEASAQAERARHDAEEEHADRVAELTRERGQLEATVEQLRAFEREYRNRLQSYLESQLRELDGRPATEPSPQSDAEAAGQPGTEPSAGASESPAVTAVSAVTGVSPADRPAEHDGAASMPDGPAREASDGHGPGF